MKESLVRTVSNTVDASEMDLEVHVERHVWSKMFGWCRAANSEVSGLFMVRLDSWGWAVRNGRIEPKAKFTAYDVYFPEQRCSGAYTELEDAAVGKLSMRLHKKKKKLEELRGWWHTHYNFNTFWSGTDDDNAQRLMRANGEWLVSIVINQKGDWLCRVDVMNPVNMVFDKVKVFLVQNSRKLKRKRNFKSDIKRWVKPLHVVEYKAPTHTPGVPHYPHNWREWHSERGYEYKQTDFLGGESATGLSKRIREGKPYKFGNYIVYNGLCISREEFTRQTGKDCWCDNGECDDCVQNKIKKCMCSGKYICSIHRKTDAKTKCPCTHDGDWDQCICSAECFDCVERLCQQYY